MLKKLCVKDILNQWESYTLEADGFYRRQEFKFASKGFCRTVDLLEPWLNKDHKQLHKVMRMFVLSCHNAAHALAKQGKHKEAEYYYSHAHFRLLSLLGQKNRRSILLEAVFMELRCTFNQLKSYLVCKNKTELLLGVKEESVRVVRQYQYEHVEEIFSA